MSNNINIKVPNDSIIKDFKEHLDLKFNQRILFSAPFGTGKSTFINDFQDEYTNKYCFVKLYPVNYSVAANEDIFELIKFDILYEMMAHHQDKINLEEEDFNFWLRMSMFMQNKPDLLPLFLHIISLHETIGKPVAKFIEVIKPIVGDFKAYTNKIKIDESDDVFSFLESFKDKKGNPYEMDATSEFIYDLVDRLKGEVLPNQENIQESDRKRENKTILVIDDLDRLDPDHIFRLFNIFSAHTHSISGDNKFGFDKVIFVCDIENIRKIYAHKYGHGVDFAGYMDKFYSIKQFEFDNLKFLAEKIIDIINNSTFNDHEQENIAKNDRVIYTLSAVLKVLSKNKVINIRSLLKSNSFLMSNKKFSTARNNITFWTHDFPLSIVFEIVKEMMGSWSELEVALLLVEKRLAGVEYYDEHQKFSDKYPLWYTHYGHEIDYLKNEVFKVLVVEHIKEPSKTTQGDFVLQLPTGNLDVVYTLRYDDEVTGFQVKSINKTGETNNISDYLNYDLLLVKVFKKLKEYGVIPKGIPL